MSLVVNEAVGEIAGIVINCDNVVVVVCIACRLQIAHAVTLLHRIIFFLHNVYAEKLQANPFILSMAKAIGVARPRVMPVVPAMRTLSH